MAVKGGRIEKPEQDFRRLEEKSEEIEEEMHEIRKDVIHTIGKLEKFNKGFLTKILHERVLRKDYEEFEKEIKYIQNELREELELTKEELEEDIKEFKEGVWEYSLTFRNFCKKAENDKEEYFKPTATGPQFSFNNFINQHHNAGKEEKYLVKKTYYYDKFTTKLEDEIEAIYEKVDEAEEDLESGKDPGEVAKSLYNHVSRFVETFSDHDTLGLFQIVRKAQKLEVNSHKNNYETYTEDDNWKDKVKSFL